MDYVILVTNKNYSVYNRSKKKNSMKKKIWKKFAGNGLTKFT